MILLFVCGILWMALILLCGGFYLAVALHLSTASALALFVGFGWNGLRSSFISKRLAVFLRTRFTQASLDVLRAIDPKRQIFFACAPHGPVSLHLCLFAAQGGADVGTATEIIERTVVMGHWLILLLPGVCQLFQLYGVVFSARSTVENALNKDANVALCVSGMPGKTFSQLKFSFNMKRVDGDKKTCVIVPRRERNGFLFLAAKRGALIVPVLSPNEDYAYDDGLTSLTSFLLFLSDYLKHWLFDLIAGFCVCRVGGLWFVQPKCNVSVRVGQPIDASLFDASSSISMSELEKQYFDSLEHLASPDYKISFE
jgi:hypothetical protein